MCASFRPMGARRTNFCTNQSFWTFTARADVVACLPLLPSFAQSISVKPAISVNPEPISVIQSALLKIALLLSSPWACRPLPRS